MADTKTINALQKIATFGTSVAAESAFNEYKTQKDTEKFEASLQTLLPEVASETRTDPGKMANAYNVGATNTNISNLDTATRSVTNQADQFAALDPSTYNKKLAQDLLPSVESIKNLQGAERSVAMSRFEDQIKSAQATHMQANKKYIQNQTKNVLSININTTIDNVLKDPRDMSIDDRAVKFDEQLTNLLAVSREKGLPDLDSQKLINDVFIGKIMTGEITADTLLEKSKFRAFVNPESLRQARINGKSIYDARQTAKKASSLLTKKQEKQILDERLERSIKQGNDIAGFILDDPKYVMGLSNDLFNESLLSKSNEVTLTNDPSKDKDIKDSRNQITQTIQAIRSTGVNVQELKNKLNGKTAHLAPVIDAVYANISGSWDNYDKISIVGTRDSVEKGYSNRLTTDMKVVNRAIAERLNNYGSDSFLERSIETVTDSFRGYLAPFSDSATYARQKDAQEDSASLVMDGKYNNRILSDMGRYESLNGKVNWNDDDSVQKFLDFTYRFDALGGSTVFTDKDSETFSGTFDRQDTDNYIKEFGLKFRDEFIRTQDPDNADRYSNKLGSDADMVQYSVNPLNNRMKIQFARFDDTFDRVTEKYTPQRVEGMWKIDVDENGYYQFYMLDKDKYEYAQKSDVFREQLQNEGYRSTSVDGSIEMDPRQFKAFANGQLQRENDAKYKADRELQQGPLFTPLGVLINEDQTNNVL